MYKIQTPTGETFLTEKPNFIRVHNNGVTFILTDRDKADGVVYHGTPYLFSDGVIYCEVDGADEIRIIKEENEILKAQLINAEEALIELYESMEVQNG